MSDQVLAKQAAAVLKARAGKFTRYEFRTNYKNAHLEEPFALVQVVSPATGMGPPEERLLSGCDTADAMYRHVIAFYADATPQPPSVRKNILARIFSI